jgi:hypothetical protein
MTSARSMSLTCLVDAIADTVGGEVAAKPIAKVKRSGSFGYASRLPESAAAQNPTVKITRVRTQPDPNRFAHHLIH